MHAKRKDSILRENTHHKPRVRKRGCKTVALLAVSACLLSSTPVFADGGAGSGSGSTWGGGYHGTGGCVSWVYQDSFGGASRDSVLAAMGSIGVKSLNSNAAYAPIDEAVNQANSECASRAASHGNDNPQCRLVAVGMVHTPDHRGDYYTGANGAFNFNQWWSAYSGTVMNRTYSYNGHNYTSSDLFVDGQTNIDALALREMHKAPRAVIAIVLANDEPRVSPDVQPPAPDPEPPAPPEYTVSVSTEASKNTTSAGDVDSVSDVIRLTREGDPVDESVTGTSVLHWRGVDGSTRSARQSFTVANNGSTRTRFSYTDIDSSWKSWPAGFYWFDVVIPSQGYMTNTAVLDGQTDSMEHWRAPRIPLPVKQLTNHQGKRVVSPDDQIASGSLYTAHVRAHSSASEHFWLYETIDVSQQKVVIGGIERDDLSKVTVTDETGATVQARVSVDDTQPGKRIVKAHVVKPASGYYTLNVPQSATPTGSDYVIPDSSKACYEGDGDHCQTGNSKQVGKLTPRPDKVWVLNEAGGMKAEDPAHTNKQGSDDRTFVTGDAIGVVVNGRIPAHLLNPFTSYSLTDDWTDSAKWIDWNHPEQVRVFVDGKDETRNFTISIDTTNHTTTVSAKPGFLTATAFSTSDKKVKLIMGGVIHLTPTPDAAYVPQRLTNKATETWNNETRPTNKPPVFVRNPKPNKIWNKSQVDAESAEDAPWSNMVHADTHTFVQRDDFTVTVNGVLPKNLADNLSVYELGDDFQKATRYVDLDERSVKVTIDGQHATNLFQVHKASGKVWVSATPALLATSANQAQDRHVRLTIQGVFLKNVLKPGQKVMVPNSGWETWNKQTVPSNTPKVKEWTPNPDKSWIRVDKQGKWQMVIDPGKTNKTGADTMHLLDKDKVASVVNGVLANDLVKVTNLTLIDDYKNADYLWDPTSNLGEVRVYEAQADTDAHSSIANIANVGRDVTDQFTITHTGTVFKAVAKPAYLAKQVLLAKPKQVTLLVPGVVNYAHGKGASQVRADFGKKPGDELSFCTIPGSNKRLTNRASQQVNNDIQQTNEPYVCGYVPPVKKQVIAEGSQGGANQDVNQKVVYPGQKVEYRLTTEPKLPVDLAYDITRVEATDVFDKYLTPDKQTLEVTDLTTGKQMVMPDLQMGIKGDYTVSWDHKAHSFTIQYAPEYVASVWKPGVHPRVQIRFEGTVDKHAPVDKLVNNQWTLTLNNMLTPSNKVANKPPKHEPNKRVTQSAKQGKPAITIDGKTLLQGDTGYYQVTLDLRQKDNAYRVYKAGITDDYDERYLDVAAKDIRVLDDQGQDMTAKFNIQVKNGVVYVYAKTVDTFIPKLGTSVKGDPQPADLALYATSSKHDPLKDPAIDQQLLGHAYTIVLPFTVIAVKKDTVVKNKAVQVTNNTRKTTNQVANPLQPLNPVKDVVVNVGDKSINGRSVYLHSTFLYQLDSSTLPANRAYQQAENWSITDPLNTGFDQYTGQWAVYAASDLYQNGKRIARKGSMLASNTFTSPVGPLFTVSQDKHGVVSVEALPTYLQLVTADNTHPTAWRAYIQCKRIHVSDRVENQFTETYNGKRIPSNKVFTRTPDLAPSIRIIKYDVKSGEKLGDRNKVAEALKMQHDHVEIAFKITNTSKVDPETKVGAWYQARNLKLDDETIAGVGKVEEFKYPKNWDTLILKPGESTIVTGVLRGVTANGKHTDRAQVTGIPLVPCPVINTTPFAVNHQEDKPTGQPATGKGQGELHKQYVSTDVVNSVEVKDGDKTVRLCADTRVKSNKDDWNGYRAQTLPATGVAIMIILGSAFTIGLTGVIVMLVKRRKMRV